MKLPRYVYAIYPFDEDGKIAGVYVGATSNIRCRMKNHVNNMRQQQELHGMMRENGFTYQILETIKEYNDRHLEYDWMDFFKEKTPLRVFNISDDCFAPDYKRCARKYEHPIWTGGGVLWQLSTS